MPDRLEHYRRRYARLVRGWLPATAEYEQWVATCVQEDTRVLDLGCGRGGIVERLGSRGQWIGADPNLASLQAHRRPALGRCCAHSERLPFPKAYFDLVVSSWVLEHMLNPQAAFREIARILRPGGRFLFLTPNARHPLPWLSRKLAALRRLQEQVVSLAYYRDPHDTFPVAYRANTHQEIERLAVSTSLRLSKLYWVTDPSYFAWDHASFWAAVGFATLLPATWKVHLVGELIKV